MKKNCLLIGINAKYIHTNLAIKYLQSYVQPHYDDIKTREFSINDNLSSILKEIYREEIHIYAFSCYIWNIDMVLKLCSSLKKLNPTAAILLGGPEVSFDAEELMGEHSFVDYIIRGEGEEAFLELLTALSQAADLSKVAGLTFRNGDQIVSAPERPLLQSLDNIPFPYDDFEQLKNKILYYETSRGCPFNCQYCLSSTLHGVRYFPMERIKREIKLLVDLGIKQIKLVDRTFNCNKQHSMEIIKYIIELDGKTNFHFEIGADLLDDEIISLLGHAPKDMFQFEIGVQSTNQLALKEVSRTMDLNKVKQNVLALQKSRKSHMHLDLIAGLPYENYESFGQSFDEIHALLPDMLQLGFLKLLKGSGLRARAKEYEIEYNSFNPYEVLKTKWVSFAELNKLKEIEQLLELYYNSGRFKHSLGYLFCTHYASYFSFYEAFAGHWKAKGLFKAAQSTKEQYNILYRFAESTGIMTTALNELIKLDWLLYFNNGSIPEMLQRYPHGSIKNQLVQYQKNIPGSSFYEVFYTDVINNPEFKQDTAVFFTKSDSETPQHVAIPLHDIIK